MIDRGPTAMKPAQKLGHGWRMICTTVRPGKRSAIQSRQKLSHTHFNNTVCARGMVNMSRQPLSAI